MVKEYELKDNSTIFFKSEQVDCLDEKNQWLNGEIIEISGRELKIHFSGYANKFDVWLEDSSDRIQKQWRFGQDFKLNNRIDVLDSYNMWKEARVIDSNQTQINVTYRGYTNKYDEWIHKNSDRISEIGSKSTAQGVGRIDPSNKYRHNKQEAQPEIKPLVPSTDREMRFAQLLSEKDLKIFPVEGDGNCLFRTVSHQLYGDTSFHDIIRGFAMRYISLEREYFSQFIVGGMEHIEEYLEQQSKNGAWGDDIEIQAMSEIYNKPFEIYAYANVPMRTFHEHSGEGLGLKLAYHGKSHYNSIVDKDKHVPLISTTPGELEKEVLGRAERGELRDMIFNSRAFFEQSTQDLEEALRESMERARDEEDFMRQAIEESANSEFMNAVSQSLNENSEEDMVKHAIEMSKNDGIPPSVLEVINSGFSFEQAIEAWNIVGDCPEMMIEYIFTTL